MKIYLACQDIDLGYHVISAHSSEHEAKEAVKVLNGNYHKLIGAEHPIEGCEEFFVEETELT